MENISLLGCTGSIGTQALEVAALHPDRFRITALTAHSNAEKLFEQLEAGESNPGAILDSYTDEGEREEVAAIFNASVPEEEKVDERALKQLMIRILENSVSVLMSQSHGDISLMQLSVNKKKRLEHMKSEVTGQGP